MLCNEKFYRNKVEAFACYKAIAEFPMTNEKNLFMPFILCVEHSENDKLTDILSFTLKFTFIDIIKKATYSLIMFCIIDNIVNRCIISLSFEDENVGIL